MLGQIMISKTRCFKTYLSMKNKLTSWHRLRGFAFFEKPKQKAVSSFCESQSYQKKSIHEKAIKINLVSRLFSLRRLYWLVIRVKREKWKQNWLWLIKAVLKNSSLVGLYFDVCPFLTHVSPPLLYTTHPSYILKSCL